MKIAIIGGGASGLMTAYLLGNEHQVEVFEKNDYLGGNIRTLGRNVKPAGLPKDVFVENGVTGFNTTTYPHFYRFLKDLGVEMRGQFLPGSLFLADGRYFQAPSLDMLRDQGLKGSLRESLKLIEMALDAGRFGLRFATTPEKSFKGKGLNDFLQDEGSFEVWMRCTCMLSYSMPYSTTERYPAEIVVRLLWAWLTKFYWVFIKGGVYAYVEKILEQFDGKIHLNTPIKSVERQQKGVLVRLADGTKKSFDAVIFATTPDQVLNMLKDPSPEERRRFVDWKANIAPTISHTDISFYKPYGVDPYSVCDQFELVPSQHYGYNTYLNNSYQIPKETPYSFAFGLDKLINPRCIIERYEHVTPLYTLEALKSRDEIIETNGERHTFHVGAYLGDGLHEGAFVSALRVSRLISMGLRTTAEQAREEMRFAMTA